MSTNENENVIWYSGYKINLTPKENREYYVTVTKDGEIVHEKLEFLFSRDEVIKVTKLYIDDMKIDK